MMIWMFATERRNPGSDNGRLLSHQRHRVGDKIHGHGQATTRHAHLVVMLQFFLLLIFQFFLALIE